MALKKKIKNQTVSTWQWHLAGQEFKTQRKPHGYPLTVPTDSNRADIQILQFRNATSTENATRTIYRASTYCNTSKSECCAVSSHKGKCVSKTKYYSSPQNISYLPRDMGKMTVFDKNTTSFAFYKASKKKGGYLSKVNHSFVLTV